MTSHKMAAPYIRQLFESTGNSIAW